MNKKAQFYEWIARLVIALILVFIAWSFASNIIKTIDESEQTFRELQELFESTPDGEIKGTNIVLNEDTGLMGFKAKTPNIVFYDQNKFRTLYFTRPDSCEYDKACLCLCNKELEQTSYKQVKNQHEFIFKCTEPTCHSFEKIDFIDKISEKTYNIQVFSMLGYTIENGFVFFRHDGNRYYPVTEAKRSELYVKNEKNNFLVCFGGPDCIPP
jgi:hypothetical protein